MVSGMKMRNKASIITQKSWRKTTVNYYSGQALTGYKNQ